MKSWNTRVKSSKTTVVLPSTLKLYMLILHTAQCRFSLRIGRRCYIFDISSMRKFALMIFDLSLSPGAHRSYR